jgi:EmrB/QacA subfamily drug resistance transporter
VKRTHRPYVLAAILLASFMAAIESNIVATSMPSIAAKLGGVSLYSWVFSSYLLMQAVSVPIYGKLADLFGRKPVFMAGLAIFLIGSLLSGLAWSMPSLIGFRFLQGLGAGAVLPLAITLVGDLYSLEERGRVQGYTASVWGISSIVGPLSGALIVQYLDWSWVFWVNLPLGVVAMALAGLYLHEAPSHKHPRIDYAGAVLLFVTLSLLMLLLTHSADWPAVALGALALGVAAGAWLFIWRERRAPEPVVRLDLWKTPLIALANGATLAAGIAMVGMVSFLPTYVQGALGTTALVAGFTLSAMSVGWPLASTITGHVLVKVGTRRLSRGGGLAVLAGALVIALGAGYGPPVAAAGSFIMGMGLGVLNTAYVVSIQTTVPWAERGAATASNLLMRILGNALGAALFGGMLNALFQRRLVAQGLAGGYSVDSVQRVLDGSGHIEPAVAAVLRDALSSSLHGVFWGVVVAGLVTVVVSLKMPEINLSREGGDAGKGAAKPSGAK